MASEREFQSALIALGDLKDDPRFAPYVNEEHHWIDFFGLMSWELTFSKGEFLVIGLARSLFTNAGVVDLVSLMDTVDDATWTRCIEAILARRGFERGMQVNPGQPTW